MTPYIVNYVGNYLGILLSSGGGGCLILCRGSWCDAWFFLIIDDFTLRLSKRLLRIWQISRSGFTSILCTLSIIRSTSVAIVCSTLIIIVEIQSAPRSVGSFFRFLLLLLLLRVLFFVFPSLFKFIINIKSYLKVALELWSLNGLMRGLCRSTLFNYFLCNRCSLVLVRMLIRPTN